MIEDFNITSTNEGQKTSDFSEWLQAMKMVAFLPDGTPPEFRRKLWLVLSEKYLQMRNIDWEKEKEKCFCDTWHEDDEDLGDQIIKDLHRTGSSLLSGPMGTINQAKLKRILVGYARWNPEVGYCQGFNMLGAIILEVMDKEEMESMKVMLYLIEGIFPYGYFSGSLSGLQVDMAVFRELMLTRLPKLAKHLEKLQGPIEERCFEPPLTNVFTMQWFLTMFCTCLPINCVLRIWDLVLIEGSGILLRAALAIWSILENKILCSKSADDFYCKMGILSAEMLNGNLLKSNELIQKIVEFGPINQLQELRDKHLQSTLLKDPRKFRFYSSDEDDEMDEELGMNKKKSIRIITRRSSNAGTPTTKKPIKDNRDRIALDIPLLKKQYDRLRERQRQAHVILSAAVGGSGRHSHSSTPSTSVSVNKLLEGKSAIVTKKGRRGPPQGAVPPMRKLENSIGHNSSQSTKSNRFIDIHPQNLVYLQNQQSNTFLENRKEILQRTRKRSDSSSFSDSDNNSSTSTSLCDEDESDRTDFFESSIESSPLHQLKINKYSNVETAKIIENPFEENEAAQCLTSTASENEQSMEFQTSDPLEMINESPESIIEQTTESNNDSLITKETENILQRVNTNINSTNLPNSTVLGENKLIENQFKSETESDFTVNEKGVTNEYFERINNVNRLSNIDLSSFYVDINVKIDEDTKLNENSDILSEENFKISPEKCHSDLAVKIIEENSKVLHRILKKGLTERDDYAISFPIIENKLENTNDSDSITKTDKSEIENVEVIINDDIFKSLKILTDEIIKDSVLEVDGNLTETLSSGEGYETSLIASHEQLEKNIAANNENVNLNIEKTQPVQESAEVTSTCNPEILKTTEFSDSIFVEKTYDQELFSKNLNIGSFSFSSDLERVRSSQEILESLPQLSEETSDFLKNFGLSIQCTAYNLDKDIESILDNKNEKSTKSDTPLEPQLITSVKQDDFLNEFSSFSNSTKNLSSYENINNESSNSSFEISLDPKHVDTLSPIFCKINKTELYCAICNDKKTCQCHQQTDSIEDNTKTTVKLLNINDKIDEEGTSKTICAAPQSTAEINYAIEPFKYDFIISSTCVNSEIRSNRNNCANEETVSIIHKEKSIEDTEIVNKGEFYDYNLTSENTNRSAENFVLESIEIDKFPNISSYDPHPQLENSDFKCTKPEYENLFSMEKSINDRLQSIKNTIKSIDSLCEDKNDSSDTKFNLNSSLTNNLNVPDTHFYHNKYSRDSFEKMFEEFECKQSSPITKEKNGAEDSFSPSKLSDSLNELAVNDKHSDVVEINLLKS